MSDIAAWRALPNMGLSAAVPKRRLQSGADAGKTLPGRDTPAGGARECSAVGTGAGLMSRPRWSFTALFEACDVPMKAGKRPRSLIEARWSNSDAPSKADAPVV